MTDDNDDRAPVERTPGKGRTPTGRPIEPAAPDEFGLVQAWWGGGKGKTTAALGMGFRAAGHGFRVHVLQFMKGGASSVEDVRGEYSAVEALPGISYENEGHYGWHGSLDGTDDEDHAARARAGLERTREIIEGAANATLDEPIDLEGPPEDGVHLLVLDEVLYAAERDLIEPDEVLDLVRSKPDGLELVLTGGHEEPSYLLEVCDLVTEVRKVKHPFDAGQRARKGTEF